MVKYWGKAVFFGMLVFAAAFSGCESESSDGGDEGEQLDGGGGGDTDFSGTWILNSSPPGRYKAVINGTSGVLYTTLDGATWTEDSTFIIEKDGDKYVTSTAYGIRLDGSVLTLTNSLGGSTYVRYASDPGTDFSGTWIDANSTPQLKLEITGRILNLYGKNTDDWLAVSTNVAINWTGVNFLTSYLAAPISLSGTSISYISHTLVKQ